MAERAPNSPLLSVQILLPEAIDRRLARWTKSAPGASWPPTGGHITLIPAFVPNQGAAEVRSVVERVGAGAKPFVLRIAEPIAVQDKTRPDYFALFLTVESSPTIDDKPEMHDRKPLHELQERLRLALDPQRQDLHPGIVGQPFLPHVTLALGLGESEARGLVRELRLQPLAAQFEVHTIWLVIQSNGDTLYTHRYPVALGSQTDIDPLNN